MIEYTVKVDSNGNKYWRNKNGRLYREDGPAIELNDGSKTWWINGKRHRTDGPAIEWNDGSKEWFINGERHRKDGPAIERSNGDKEWWINGELHRKNGPAVERGNGHKTFYINGEILTEEEFNKRTQKKKLTVAEISELLGYEVEIIKE